MSNARRPEILPWALGSLLLLVAASAIAIAFRESPDARPAGSALDRREPDRHVLLEARAVTVAPGVYQLGAMIPSAVYVIETSEGLVLVDAGVTDHTGLLMEQMSDLGLDPTQVRAILLTHAHGDHSLGAMPLKLKTGATIYAGRDDAQVLRDGGPREAIFSIFDEASEYDIHPTDVDVELTGGELLNFGDTRIEVLATPGHTPGSTCYALNRGSRVFFGGDTVMSSRALGTYAAYHPPRYRGDARAFLTTLRKLSALPAPDVLLPGHPRDDEVPQDPRIPPAQWSSMLDHGIHELEELIERYEKDGADFLDGEPKEFLPGLHYLGDIDGSAVYVVATPSQLLLFDAPGGDGFAEWLDARLKAAALGSIPLTAVLLTSCGPEAASGLPALLEKTQCRVVSAESGVATLRNVGVPDARLTSVEAFEAAGSIDVKALPLVDGHPGAIAYMIRWCGKKVLLSGRIPLQLSSAELATLVRALAVRPGAINAYRKSAYRLLELYPNLWLPAKPLHGRNANWHPKDWQDFMWDSVPKLQKLKSHSTQPN